MCRTNVFGLRLLSRENEQKARKKKEEEANSL